MKRSIWIAAIFLMFPLFAESIEFEPVDRQIVYHIFNGDYHQANELIDARIRAQPDHPKYYFFKTYNATYARYFGPQEIPRDSLLRLTRQFASKTIDLADEMEETTEIKFYLGQAYSYLSRTDIMRRELTDAYFDARKGRNYLQDVLEEAPDFYDAQLNLGVLNYFTATRLSGWQNTLAWFLGMDGDRHEALSQIALVEEKGGILQPEAHFIMINMYRFLEPDPEKAETSIAAFLEKYPGNRFIRNQHLNIQLGKLVTEQGVEYLAANIDSLRAVYNINNPDVINNLGYGTFMNNEDYPNAVKIFELNVVLFPDIANGYDSLGEAYLNMGDTENAARNYRIAYQKLDSDTTISEQFREVLRNSIEPRLKELNAL